MVNTNLVFYIAGKCEKKERKKKRKDDQKCLEITIVTSTACHTSANMVDDLSDILRDEMGTCMHNAKSLSACIYFIEELMDDIGVSPSYPYLDKTTNRSVVKAP